MSFSKEANWNLALGLFTLWPGHEIDVKILVQATAIPSLHDALAIDNMKAVSCPSLTSKLVQCRIYNVNKHLVRDPTAPPPLGDDSSNSYAQLSRTRLLRQCIWQRERLQHGGETQDIMRGEPTPASKQREHIALQRWQHRGDEARKGGRFWVPRSLRSDLE
jgi:hypothetical protein